MKLQRTTRRGLLLGAAALCAPVVQPRAQGRYPSRPVEIYVGFPPGGGTDIDARVLAPYLSREIGGTVVVMNRPGASGEVAWGHVARAPADGHTLAITNMPGLLTIPIERQARFKIDDFDLIANIATDPAALGVRPDSPYRTLEDIIRAAREKPGELTYGSSGIGTDDHLTLVLLQKETGISITHVPFAGSAPMYTSVVGGHVTIAGGNVSDVMQMQDKLRVIVQGGATRSVFAPNVPTFKELGLPIEFGSERGIVAPRGVPAEIMHHLSEAVRKAMENPEFKQKMTERKVELTYETGEAWGGRLRQMDTHFRELWRTSPWS